LNEWTPKGALPSSPAQRARSRQGRIELGGRQNSGSSDRYGFCGLRHGCRCAPRSSVSFLLNGSGEAATQSGSLAQASKTGKRCRPEGAKELPIYRGQRSRVPRGTIAGQPRMIEPRHVTPRATYGGPLKHPCIAPRPPPPSGNSRREVRRHGGDDRSKVSTEHRRGQDATGVPARFRTSATGAVRVAGMDRA